MIWYLTRARLNLLNILRREWNVCAITNRQKCITSFIEPVRQQIGQYNSQMQRGGLGIITHKKTLTQKRSKPWQILLQAVGSTAEIQSMTADRCYLAGNVRSKTCRPMQFTVSKRMPLSHRCLLQEKKKTHRTHIWEMKCCKILFLF